MPEKDRRATGYVVSTLWIRAASTKKISLLPRFSLPLQDHLASSQTYSVPLLLFFVFSNVVLSFVALYLHACFSVSLITVSFAS